MDLDLKVLFPSEYLKVEDLKGKNVTVRISGLQHKAVPMTGGKKEMCCVASMEKTQKKFIMNTTNTHAMVLLVGDLDEGLNTKGCIGKRITLTQDVDRLGRKEVGCVRIIGSPDATKERATVYSKAWSGERKGGKLIGRIKQALSLLLVTDAPAVESEAIDDGEMDDSPIPEDDIFGEDPEPGPNPPAAETVVESEPDDIERQIISDAEKRWRERFDQSTNAEEVGAMAAGILDEITDDQLPLLEPALIALQKEYLELYQTSAKGKKRDSKKRGQGSLLGDK